MTLTGEDAKRFNDKVDTAKKHSIDFTKESKVAIEILKKAKLN